MRNIDLFKNYENAKLYNVSEYRERHQGQTYGYGDIGKQDINGIPICVTRNQKGTLDVTFIPDTHLLAIGATRSGKTTGYVVPTINVLLNKRTSREWS